MVKNRRMKYFHSGLGIFALACNMLGSFLIASNGGFQVLGYVFFTLGVIPATYLLIISDANKTLLLTNFYFFAMNLFGIYQYWS